VRAEGWGVALDSRLRGNDDFILPARFFAPNDLTGNARDSGDAVGVFVIPLKKGIQ